MATVPPKLIVRPDGQLLVDEKLEIIITGIAKNQKTTLHAVTRERDIVFESCCCFMSDENGEINLATRASLSGSYTGVSPMGIFWSMVQAPGQRPGLKLVKKDLDTPFTTSIFIYAGHLPIQSIHSSSDLEPICLGSIERWYKARTVKKQIVRDGRIRGVLYLPSEDGPYRGVIDMHGTVGGLQNYRAALLASRGFACLYLAYIAYEDLPEKFSDLDFDYFMEAIDWLSSHRAVYSGGIGVCGQSRGGMIGLLMAANSPKISCVASISGPTLLVRYPMKYKDGLVMPHVPFQRENAYMKDDAWVTKDSFPYSRDDLIPVWKNDSKILNIVGEDDQSLPRDCVQYLKDNFPADKTDNFEIVSYPKTGHIIEPPYSPLFKITYHKLLGAKFLWGGYPEQHAFAQEDAWQRVLQHFKKYIPRTSK